MLPASAAHLGSHGNMDAPPGAIDVPLPEVMVKTFPLRVFFWWRLPLGAAHDYSGNSSDHHAHIERAGASSRFCQWDQISDKIPLAVVQVG